MRRRALLGVMALMLAAAGPAHALSWRQGSIAYGRHDYSRAAEVFLVLARQGDARAQAHLGFMYATGRGVPQNLIEAGKWYHRAANQGNTTAQFMLGLMYDKGQGVRQDYVLAYKWLNLAVARAPRREREAWAPIRDGMASKMDGSEIAEGQRLALQWRPLRER